MRQPRRSEKPATRAAMSGSRAQKAWCSRHMQGDSLAMAIVAQHGVRYRRGCRGADKHGHSRQDHGVEFTVVREPAPSSGALDPVH
jgi:hypothetical protein